MLINHIVEEVISIVLFIREPAAIMNPNIIFCNVIEYICDKTEIKYYFKTLFGTFVGNQID